ncbi:MAG: DUF983 domain-containing protein [Flavobacteriaceae bacterium]|nr:DUF983 domain-containing protein [Flavobacteriaceae bacterium]
MLKKGTKLNSILTGSCPKCQNESMYADTNPYHLSETLKMRERCSHCHLKYMIEPSFFYGSMYVSYAVGVAFATAFFVISFLILGLSLLASFISILVGLIVLLPFILRVSRNIWINIFIKYQGD